MKTTKKVTIAIVLVILAGLYYYVSLPAINIHSSDTWFFILGFVVVILAWYIVRKRMRPQEIRESKTARALIGLLLAIGVVYVIGSILSSPIVNAKKYQKLMTVKEGNFADDVEEISFDKVPLLDKDTAEILGDRKMGSMVDMVSQFEADDIYSQINYKERPVRVTPLKYASFIKWITNQSEGIPAYIRIDMASQNTDQIFCQRVSEPQYLPASEVSISYLYIWGPEL